ncbi:hypothetical protein BCL79_0611 [Stenotrophomonas rhizophila]|uniref:Lipoprotein n=1 Tax=Stenotrophomonas rhizophila TaxID=216778 RepID=A0A498CDS0_9GAMM|nr:hypothetical protein [Stenotrophomonas rhizophila]RLK56228.1 hypothetical protein BCL79_0611 [Stenotrophomonas rhizophila]
MPCRLIATIALTLLFSGCKSEPEVWTAFVYPPGQSLAAEDAHRAIYGRFSTFEDCQSAAIGSLRQHQNALTDEQTDELGMGEYECGVGCRYESQYDLYMCKETRK